MKASKQKQQKQFTIKQFQWYEVQTKVRQIMADLLQPFNKKQTQQTIKMNQMKRNVAVITKKLQQHDFLLERENAVKPKYIEIQDEKIQQMQRAILEHKAITNTDIKKMEVTIQVYEQKITQLNQLEKRVDRQVIQRVQNFKKYKEHVDESISLMMKKIQSEQDEVNLLKSSTRTQINKLQSKMISFDNRLKDLEDEVKRKSSQMNRLLEESINHNEKIIKAELKIIDVVNRVQERQKDVKLSQKFFGKVKQVENDLQFIHRYLQAYQPLYVQMQISEALDIIVKGRQRRKLCIFQQKRFAKFHNHILMNDSNSLQDLMSAFSNNIRKIINRNRKYIINLKVQESIKYGANLYEFRDDGQVNNYHDEEDEDQNKKQVNIVIPEQDIERILQKKWTSMLPDVTIYVQNQIKPTRQWMKQLQQQSVLRLVDNQKKLDSIKQKINSIQAQQNLIQKHYTSQVLQLKQKTIDQQERNELVKSYIKDILNFNSVLNHIVIQDQIDRQGTALYALKSGKQQTQNKISPTIQLDPSCVNCDHKTSNIINQAFKMACLAYNPSQIRIDDQYFSREQILEISTNILERLKKKLDGLQQKKSSKILTNGKEQEENTYQKTQRERKSQTIVVKDTKDSASFSRSNRNSSKNSAKSIGKQKNMQTMLPVLSSSSKKNRPDIKQRSTHLSVFY